MSGLDGAQIGTCDSCGRTVYIGPSGAQVHTNAQPCPKTGLWATNPKITKVRGGAR